MGKKKGRRVEERSAYDGPSYGIGDPALAEYFGLGNGSDAGMSVTETTALALSAVYRSVALISGTIAQLPLKTYSRGGQGARKQVKSWLDDPGGEVLTPFELKELTTAHLLLHGNAFLLHQMNGQGTILSVFPVHPRLVQVELTDAGRRFTVTGGDGADRMMGEDRMTQIMGLSVDGVRGMSVLSYERNVLGTALAGDQAAGRIFKNGMLLGGVLSMPGATEAQTTDMLAGLKAKAQGSKHAGDILGMNIEAKFEPWAMSAEDAQFLESRQFSISEVARIFGLPVQMLSADGASSWGSGISELIRAMQKFTLVPWTSRIEERLSRLLPQPRFVEFDYRGLLEGTPRDVTDNLIAEVAAGLTTIDEARQVLNKPPLAAQASPETE